MAKGTIPRIQVKGVTTTDLYDIMSTNPVLPAIRKYFPNFPEDQIVATVTLFFETGVPGISVSVNNDIYNDSIYDTVYSTGKPVGITSVRIKKNGVTFTAQFDFE